MSFRVLIPATGLLLATVACSATPTPLESTAPTPLESTAAPAKPGTGTVGPNDWPQWQGQNRDGKSPETGLLKSWPAAGPKKLWTVSNLGTGYGTPSVVAGAIYGVGTRGGKDGVWALNEADGKELWFTPFADPAKTLPNNNGPASTPTYADGRLYTVSGNGTVAAMDAASGKLLWHKSYLEDFGGKLPRWGYSDSVLVDGDKVICAPNGSRGGVVALKADSGDVIWATEIVAGDGGGYSSPVKMTVGDIPTYVVLLGQTAGIVGVHADTGKLLWSYNKKPAAGGVAQIPTPVIDGKHVWVSSSYGGGAALLELTPETSNKIDVKVIKAYAKPELNNHHGGMILVNGHIYFGHDQNRGIPACVDAKTGEIVWKEDKEPDGMKKSAAVSYADGRLYYRFENHVLALVEPSPKGWKLISSFTLPNPSGKESWPHPVIANGKLYIRDQDKMHCFNIKAGK